jgi:hypothetical protein
MATSELQLNPEPNRQPQPPNRKGKPAMKSETSAQKYQRANDECWARLPHWKQLAIDNDRKNGNVDSHLRDEFAHIVAEYYETL